jgi:glycosyltransferase involved in cell wall biosynthesis
MSVLGRLQACTRLGHTVDLLTYHVGQNVVIPGVTIRRTPALPGIREVPVGPSHLKPLLDLFLCTKAFRLLQKERFDLLHTHEEASFFGVLLARYFRIPHLYDMHSSLPQQLGNFRTTRCRPLIGLFEGLERWVINASSAVITICPALAEHVSRINGQVAQVMIENVGSGIEPSPMSAAEMQAFKAALALPDDTQIVLYTGTFEPYQGLDLLIASARQLLCQRQDVLFLLVGGKPEQVRHYQDLVAQHGLSAHFRFTGIRPPRDMPGFLHLATALVSPRTSGTNTPLKIYGYLQSGKPIVATNLPTHTQVLTEAVAVLVDPEPQALAQGLLTVLTQPALAAQLGAQAQQLFATHYSFQTFVDKTEQALLMALR